MLKDEKARKIFNVMIDRGLIPAIGKFQVTEELIEESFFIFRELFPPLRNKFPKPSEVKLSKRIAGLNFLKLLDEREETVTVVKKQRSTTRCGFVYVISNPSFPNKYKIGMTTDLHQRLDTYQTYDPNRAFKVEHYRFVEDRRKTEKFLLETCQLDIDKGEWVSDEKIKKMITSL